MKSSSIVVTMAMISLISLTVPAIPASNSVPEFWVKFPHPKTIYISEDISKLPSLAPGHDPGGHSGCLSYMLQSLSGLVALSTREKRSTTLLWINHASNDSYSMWLDTIISVTKAQSIRQLDCLALVKEFMDRGIVKGYILYRADKSTRALYAQDPQQLPGYDDSVNVATSLAPVLGGIIVEESTEPVFRKLGLKRLLDARGKSQEWVFDTYREKFNRGMIHFADPKMPFSRDYAVATRSLSFFGRGSFTERVLEWLRPNALVLGWNEGDDEFIITQQTSQWAKYQTASNWCINLPLLSVVRAGEDIPWESLQVNAQSQVDPLALDWRKDVHYTSFIMTDGDNLQWYTGSFFAGSNHYWTSPSRTQFPFGWTSCVDSMSRVAVPVLAHFAQTASSKDNAVLFPGGYFYADRYGDQYGKGIQFLDAHIDQVADRMRRLGITVMMTNSPEWESESSLRAYKRFAQRLIGLNAILVIQYCTYSAGQGKVHWVENREGELIPIIPARYGIWEHHSVFKNEGTPAFVASRINAARHEGSLTSDEYIDWVTVHAWSFFRNNHGSMDLWAEDVDQQSAASPDITRGVTPVEWCVNRLASHVQVVTPEEMVWRMRLHLKTRETLDALARRLAKDPRQPKSRGQRLIHYRQRLTTRALVTDEDRKEAFEELKHIRFGQ